MTVGDVVRYQYGTALYVVLQVMGAAGQVRLLDMGTGIEWGVVSGTPLVVVATYSELHERSRNDSDTQRETV
jgi:hypothetical protein